MCNGAMCRHVMQGSGWPSIEPHSLPLGASCRHQVRLRACVPWTARGGSSPQLRGHAHSAVAGPVCRPRLAPAAPGAGWRRLQRVAAASCPPASSRLYSIATGVQLWQQEGTRLSPEAAQEEGRDAAQGSNGLALRMEAATPPCLLAVVVGSELEMLPQAAPSQTAWGQQG